MNQQSNYPRFALASLLKSVAAVAIVLASYGYFGSLGVALAILGIGLVLRHSNRRSGYTRSRWPHRLLIGPAATWCALSLTAWGLLGYGPLWTTNSWPVDLSQMVELSGSTNASVRAHRLAAGFLDSQYVWRIEADSDGLHNICTEFGMEALSPSGVPTEFWHAFPAWWRPSVTDRATFYSTPAFPNESRGQDGFHFMAMHEPQTGRVFVWYKLNF